jgi:branched-chain amino acid transport system permease protein
MSAGLLLQSFVNALASGGLFALFGLSFGLIYSTTQILHFAHGAIYVCAAYIFYLAYVSANWPFAPATVVCIAGAGLLGWATMRLLYRPLIARRTSGAMVMIASLGLYIAVENIIVLAFGNSSRVVSKGSVQTGFDFGSVYVTPLQVVTLAVSLAVTLLLFLLITRSKLGRGLRAIADNANVADLIGIDVERLQQTVFAIGSMVLAIAAILNASDIGISPGMGLPVVLVATVAAIVGGANSIFAGIAGGFLIGAIQSFGVIWIDPRWQNLLIFLTLIAILIVRPTGMFGTTTAR